MPFAITSNSITPIPSRLSGPNPPTTSWPPSNAFVCEFLTQDTSKDALKRMRHTVRAWKLRRQTPAKLAELAQQRNPTIRGWWKYYGAFYRTAMHKLFKYLDRKLEQW